MQGEAVQTAQSMSTLAFQVNDTSQHLSKAMPSVTCMLVSTSAAEGFHVQMPHHQNAAWPTDVQIADFIIFVAT